MRTTFCLVRSCAVVMAIGWGLAMQAEGSSVIGTHSANGVVIYSHINVGFNDPVFGTSVAGDFANNSAGALANSGIPLGTATALKSILPAFTTVPKDIAQGTITSEFELGVPFGTTPIDEGRFTVNAYGSAVDAKNIAGNPSDAVITTLGEMHFYVDQFGLPPNVVIGQLNLPGLRTLLPYETALTLDVFDNSVNILTMLPGGSAMVVPLATAHNYDLYLKYNMLVPYGNDPPFSLDYQFNVVPEPSTVVMAAMGLVGLFAFAWRKGRCAKN